MRLKSGIWVAAYVRRLGAMPLSAMVVRKGDADAGAIFIKISRLDGTAQVLRPALSIGDGGDTERRWSRAFGAEGQAENAVDAYLLRQAEFDTDMWVVEVEDRQGRHFLDDVVVDE